MVTKFGCIKPWYLSKLSFQCILFISTSLCTLVYSYLYIHSGQYNCTFLSKYFVLLVYNTFFVYTFICFFYVSFFCLYYLASTFFLCTYTICQYYCLLHHCVAIIQLLHITMCIYIYIYMVIIYMVYDNIHLYIYILYL